MNPTLARPSHHRQQMRVYIIAGLLLCDFVLCGYLPSHQRLAALQEARTRQQSMIRMAAGQKAELPLLKARLKDAEKVAECFETYVPLDNALGAFLQRIAALMTQNELTDQAVLPEKEQEAGDLGYIPVHIACKGTLGNIFSFFDNLQTMDRLVRIHKVTLQNDVDFTGGLTLQTDAFIFYQLKRNGTQGAGNPDSAGGAGRGT